MAQRRNRGLAASRAAEPEPEYRDHSLEGEDEDEDEVVPPFFNTTFSTHRVSPLYVGPESLNSTRLGLLARRLRDTLVGDVVRGIQIGLEATDTPLGQVGPLKTVELRWFQAQRLIGAEHGLSDDATAEDVWGEFSDNQKQGLWIDIRHENAAYVALLLPGLSQASPTARPLAQDWTLRPQAGRNTNGSTENHFCDLPLLLLRMPLPLKTVVSDWLSTTFDCRVSRLTLGTKTLVNVWETWARVAGVPERGAEFIITLAFNAPLPDTSGSTESETDGEAPSDQLRSGLRTMDITISSQDLRRFVQAGMTIQPPENGTRGGEIDARERRRLAGVNSDDGWAWRTNLDRPSHPFTEALGRYLGHHLALNLFHPSVRVTQISCAGFVLGQQRLKILKPTELSSQLHRASWMFVAQLGERIQKEDIPRIF